MVSRLPVTMFAFALLAGGCARPEDAEPTEQGTLAIVGGSTATAYPEAALIDIETNGQVRGACSGAVIAPKVVLTAGHCIVGGDGWQVKVPFAQNQTARASTAKNFDYTSRSELVERTQHDVGLLFLDTPIKLDSYPSVATQPLPDQSTIVNIGRISNGRLSNTALYVSQPLAVVDATGQGFPYDYAAAETIESGDSGGPDEVPGVTPHQIVAVNSGAGGGNEVLARVDLVATWISQQIDAHGGLPGADAGAPSPSPTPTPAPAPEGGSTGGGTGNGSGAKTTGDAGTSAASPGRTRNPRLYASDAGCSTSPKAASRPGALTLALGLIPLAVVVRRRRRTALLQSKVEA